MASPGSSANPPSYADAQAAEPARMLTDRPCTLVLDKTFIYPSVPPARVLYEMSNDPCLAATKVYGIERISYRLSDHDGDGTIRSRSTHMYDFEQSFLAANNMRHRIDIKAKSGSKVCYKDVVLTPGAGGWSSCDAEGHFTATSGGRLSPPRRNKDIVWKDTSGRIVAVEKRVFRVKGSKALTALPRFELKCTLDQRDLDLLVTAWTARVWAESQRELHEPLSWEDGEPASRSAAIVIPSRPWANIGVWAVKRIASTRTERGITPLF